MSADKLLFKKKKPFLIMLSHAAISGKNIKAALGTLSIQISEKLPVKLNRCRS